MPDGRPSVRLDGLDGIRAVAAWYVVLHHVWLLVYVRFPQNAGPWATGWMRWGHLAVAVFIVLSGFSLALAPSRHDDQLVGGNARFIRRRAWRILPPYWVALALSFAVVLLYVGKYTGTVVTSRSAVVHGLLLQDVIGSTTPNGAFWSIAIEWQIYFLFPLLLWLTRRYSSRTMVTATTLAVVGVYLLATNVAPFDPLLHLTPQFLALFAVGAGVGRIAMRRSIVSPATRRVAGRGAVVSLIALAVVLALGSPATLVAGFFWLDLGAGLVMALVLYALAVEAMPRLRTVLSTRTLTTAGQFSYSTYLMHAPTLAVVQLAVVNHLVASSGMRFALLLVIGLPVVAATTYGFHLLFERPFVEHRSFASLRVRLGSVRPLEAVPAVARD